MTKESKQPFDSVDHGKKKAENLYWRDWDEIIKQELNKFVGEIVPTEAEPETEPETETPTPTPTEGTSFEEDDENWESDELNPEETDEIIPLEEIGEFDSEWNFNIREDIKGNDEIGSYIEVRGVKYYDSETRSKIKHWEDKKWNYIKVNWKKYDDDNYYIDYVEAFLWLWYEIGQDEQDWPYFRLWNMGGWLWEQYETKYFQKGIIFHTEEHSEEHSEEWKDKNIKLKVISDIWEFDGDWKFKMNENIETWKDKIGSYIVLKWEKYYESSSVSDEFEWLWYYIDKWRYFENGAPDFWSENYDANSLYIWHIKEKKANWTWIKYFPSWTEFHWTFEDGCLINWKEIRYDWAYYEWEFNGESKEWHWKITYQDWSSYEWDWKNDKREWHWKYTYSDWTIYEWEWLNWRKNWKCEKYFVPRTWTYYWLEWKDGIAKECKWRVEYLDKREYEWDFLVDFSKYETWVHEPFFQILPQAQNSYLERWEVLEDKNMDWILKTDSGEHIYKLRKWSIEEKWNEFITMYGDKKPNEHRDAKRWKVMYHIDYITTPIINFDLTTRKHKTEWKFDWSNYQFENKKWDILSLPSSIWEKWAMHAANLINFFKQSQFSWLYTYNDGALYEAVRNKTQIVWSSVTGYVQTSTSSRGYGTNLLSNVEEKFGPVSAKELADWLNRDY